jgi:hypothetical protein
LVLSLLLAVASLAADLKIATLNCFLLFDPKIDHRGKVDDEQRMTEKQYDEKLGNLASMIKGYQVVGLQETGGGAEIAALAARSGMSWAWERGKDTATGEEVGLLYNLSEWQVSSKGRVPDLDRILSKHLLVAAKSGTHRVYFLVVHLLRPIGNQVIKHKAQLIAIGEWMRRLNASEPKSVVVVLGDTNSALTENGISLFGIGAEAGEHGGFRATHLTNKAYDRLVLLGPAKWLDVEIRKSPYGTRPIAPVKRVWTDHYLLGAVLSTN